MKKVRWWFSAMVEYALHVEGQCEYRLVKSVLLVRAGDFDEALNRVIAAARAREEAYRNADGELVRWMLKRVVTIDWLDSRLTSGREVYSEPGEVVRVPSVDFSFTPEVSGWGSSGV